MWRRPTCQTLLKALDISSATARVAPGLLKALPILHSFWYLFNSLVRPHLEYHVSISFPLLKQNEEQIKIYFFVHSKQFQERQTFCMVIVLLQLLSSMKYHWLQVDMIKVYKILNSNDESLYELFKINSRSHTRGYNLKLQKSFDKNVVYNHFLNVKVINNWNSLLHGIVNAVSMNSFRTKFNKFGYKKVWILIKHKCKSVPSRHNKWYDWWTSKVILGVWCFIF